MRKGKIKGYMNQVRAKKALGQHFLTDLNIARKICFSLSGGEAGEPVKVLPKSQPSTVLLRKTMSVV